MGLAKTGLNSEVVLILSGLNRDILLHNIGNSKSANSVDPDEATHHEPIYASSWTYHDCSFKYSQLSLSRLRLSRITAYLEEEMWSLL